MSILLGCIADDFTGATDLANNLVRAGMRAVQTIGVPSASLGGGADAVVVALKSRTIPAADAIAQSLAALRWLREQGARQIYFKYCSTFDSTPAGNIGPVTEALLDALGSDFTIATPAFPDMGRTVYRGYLFVGDALLDESGMQSHPLTPMTDANLVRVLQAQCRARVGLVDYRTVGRGADAIRDRFAALRAAGVRIAIVDAISNEDLLRLGPALAGMPLVTAGSGVAIALPANFGLAPSNAASALPPARGLRAVVSGSCSAATQRQVRAFVAAGGEALRLDPREPDAVARALAWAEARTGRGTVLVYTTAPPEEVKAMQHELGVERAGRAIEQALAHVAQGLVARGVRQLVVAGGETSGACVQALGVEQLQIGAQIDTGVPWCYARGRGEPLHLALKSGNFGADDFFTRAFGLLA
jgi:uncharacterized protein YgbK (DUF1537 family)